MISWAKIFIHHSAGQDTGDLDVAGIFKYHTDPKPKGKGWSDVGYQSLVEMVDGWPVCIFGRPLTRRGSHGGPKWNGVALSVCFIGNYSLVAPPQIMLEAAGKRIIRPWCSTFDITKADIWPHHKTKNTECPGKLFDMQRLKRLI